MKKEQFISEINNIIDNTPEPTNGLSIIGATKMAIIRYIKTVLNFDINSFKCKQEIVDPAFSRKSINEQIDSAERLYILLEPYFVALQNGIELTIHNSCIYMCSHCSAGTHEIRKERCRYESCPGKLVGHVVTTTEVRRLSN